MGVAVGGGGGEGGVGRLGGLEEKTLFFLQRKVMTWLRVNFKSGEELGLDPLSGGQSEESFFLSLRVNSYADVFVLDRPSCVGYIRHAHRFLRTLRPMSICRKKYIY